MTNGNGLSNSVAKEGSLVESEAVNSVESEASGSGDIPLGKSHNPNGRKNAATEGNEHDGGPNVGSLTSNTIVLDTIAINDVTKANVDLIIVLNGMTHHELDNEKAAKALSIGAAIVAGVGIVNAIGHTAAGGCKPLINIAIPIANVGESGNSLEGTESIVVDNKENTKANDMT